LKLTEVWQQYTSADDHPKCISNA